MKIGILTQPLCQNYGGLLQNYALQQVLIQTGHEPQTIDHDRFQKATPLRYCLGRAKRLLKGVLHAFFPHRFRKPVYMPSKREMATIAQNTQFFIDKYINRTHSLKTHKEFLQIASSGDYQAYVVGSDQCWRPKYNRSFLKEMFLSFAVEQENVKRIAYAASLGVDTWEMSPEMTSECACLAKRFDLVTVREDSGVPLCKKYLDVDACHVLDPTMLLPKEHYIHLIENEKERESPGNLFYYILDPDESKSSFVSKVAESEALTPFTVLPKYQAENRTEGDIKRHLDECVYPAVTSWLRAFMDAEMVIVDSFHGMVFSIIFNKPFFVLGNKKRGMSRFLSLLRQLSLEDRLLETSQIELSVINQPIDWNAVNQKLIESVSYSKSLLYKALS